MKNKYLGFFLVSSVTLVGCASDFEYAFKQQDSQSTASSPEDLDSSALNFESTVYPILKDHCSSCHSDQIAPFFANSSSVQKSHDVVQSLQLVHFDNIRGSRLIEKVSLGHNCWTGDCRADSNELLTAAESWKNLNSKVKEVKGFKTAELTIPSNIGTMPKATNQAPTLIFDLAGIAPGIPSNAKLAVFIRNFDEFSYEFSALEIGTSASISVRGVNVFINSANAKPGSAFSVIDRTVAPTGGNPVGTTRVSLTTSAVLVPKALGFDSPSQGGPGIDSVIFTFDYIGEPEDPQKRRFLEVQDLLALHCNACHTGERTFNREGEAYAVPPLNLATEADFKNRVYRVGRNLYESPVGPRFLVKPRDPNNSALYRSMGHGVDGQVYPEIGVVKTNGTNYVMAPGFSAASRKEVGDKIKAWINGMSD